MILFRALTDLVRRDLTGPDLFVFFAKNLQPDVVGTTWASGVCHEDGGYNAIIAEYMENDLVTAEVMLSI